MARKKKHEEHENHERWLVSYADFITLLFAFFVVLYAISQVDLKKLDKAAKSFGNSFGGSSEPGGKHKSPGKRVDPDAWRYAPIFPNVVPSEDQAAVADSQLTDVKQRLRSLLVADGLDAGVEVGVEARGLVVGLEPKALFGDSWSTLQNRGVQLLERLTAVARRLQSPLLLRHASQAPSGAGLARSFERSNARVASVLRQLAESQGEDAEIFVTSEGEVSKQVTERLEVVYLRKGLARKLRRSRQRLK
ncbi:MAG TPA: hypothetical protein DEA08_00705 [Planctomycetes bacterium]|nr:hypothetical protein [Planctomycetota bacterium]